MTGSNVRESKTASPDHDAVGVTAELTEALGELFRLAGSRRIHEGRRRRSRVDLSRTAWDFLQRVERYGPVSVTELADQLELSLATTSRTLRDLEAKGLLLAKANPRDARSVRFTISAKGRRVQARFRGVIETDLATAINDWSDRDRRQLVRLLGRLNQAFREGPST